MSGGRMAPVEEMPRSSKASGRGYSSELQRLSFVMALTCRVTLWVPVLAHTWQTIPATRNGPQNGRKATSDDSAKGQLNSPQLSPFPTRWPSTYISRTLKLADVDTIPERARRSLRKVAAWGMPQTLLEPLGATSSIATGCFLGRFGTQQPSTPVPSEFTPR